MSRSGYTDDIEQWALIRWRGAVTSAIRGNRGQAFLKEMLGALDALPQKRLIREDLQDEYEDGAVCALGAVGRSRGLDMGGVDPDDHETVAKFFGIPHAMACEIMWMNDEHWWRITPEERFARVREWVAGKIGSALTTPKPTESQAK